ncbi:hypothetical protein F3Y22_tig00005459pilonHSYRG00097 [Hibiscus syriacus]|uniref:O-fucosyltransferase family protein n=1 Tax=Hibiscus syriacus TaxID=106335 RepID=A0A6A3CFS9_HIBSY|nr:hypothetical protein F3Y22_tig00005459pilonHSYRG00097 [Hibiscus syriacus]
MPACLLAGLPFPFHSVMSDLAFLRLRQCVPAAHSSPSQSSSTHKHHFLSIGFSQEKHLWRFLFGQQHTCRSPRVVVVRSVSLRPSQQNIDPIGRNNDSSAVVAASNLGQPPHHEELGEFWKQPDGMGYRPCLDFSREYRRATESVVKAMINVIWVMKGNKKLRSNHFNRRSVLEDDVRILSSLPSTHVMTRPVERDGLLFTSRLNGFVHVISSGEGSFALRGLDSRLSKDLLLIFKSFAARWHFKLEICPKSMNLVTSWHRAEQRTVPCSSSSNGEGCMGEDGCSPGLSCLKLWGLQGMQEYTGLGDNLGGKEALSPLTREFPHFYNDDLALPGELEPFAKKASFMAAVDFIVSLKSDVFMPSHGGNMGHAIQGQRAFSGHKTELRSSKAGCNEVSSPGIPSRIEKMVFGGHDDSRERGSRMTAAGHEAKDVPPSSLTGNIEPLQEDSNGCRRHSNTRVEIQEPPAFHSLWSFMLLLYATPFRVEAWFGVLLSSPSQTPASCHPSPAILQAVACSMRYDARFYNLDLAWVNLTLIGQMFYHSKYKQI